jgi:hypothetical protein
VIHVPAVVRTSSPSTNRRCAQPAKRVGGRRSRVTPYRFRLLVNQMTREAEKVHTISVAGGQAVKTGPQREDYPLLPDLDVETELLSECLVAAGQCWLALDTLPYQHRYTLATAGNYRRLALALRTRCVPGPCDAVDADGFFLAKIGMMRMCRGMRGIRTRLAQDRVATLGGDELLDEQRLKPCRQVTTVA